MTKIINTDQAIDLSQKITKNGKTVVLVGGCFDILHVGHIAFLTKAKKAGDALFVLLESDESIKKIKGLNRPINTQTDRAIILESLEIVDYVITLPTIENDKDYDNLVISLKPAIIAITKGDPMKHHKDRQAKLVNGKVLVVSASIVNKSTTRLINILNEI
ncbi:MAG TPA: adenylyltransferase/cytidyltransferase family protein [Candidatus Limnocylindrales bacterium]|nr:adenylyltransferase/cytidyltransferase family protein [Candidatus Limnocylindrales bacterium]